MIVSPTFEDHSRQVVESCSMTWPIKVSIEEVGDIVTYVLNAEPLLDLMKGVTLTEPGKVEILTWEPYRI